MSRSEWMGTLHSSSISVVHPRVGDDRQRRRFWNFANGTRTPSPVGGPGGLAASLTARVAAGGAGPYSQCRNHLKSGEKYQENPVGSIEGWPYSMLRWIP